MLVLYARSYDLDWNPSTLEHGTGRVDRIGSLGERLVQPVVVFEPYIGGTHDGSASSRTASAGSAW